MAETPKQAAKRIAKSSIRGEWKPEALHSYIGEDGAPLYWRIRARLDNGEKWIRPMRPCGHGYELGEPEFPAGYPGTGSATPWAAIFSSRRDSSIGFVS